MIPEWVEKYVGIPFVEMMSEHSACDCYGLIRLIFKEQYDIELMDFTGQYATTKDGAIINDLIRDESQKWDKVSFPQFGDIVLYKVKGLLWHMGFFLADKLMLHTEPDVGAYIERVDSIRWKNRFEGYYRYNAG
jgi:cell wall-associated NlpC family hydrolase